LSDNRRVLESKGTLVMVGGEPNGNWIGPFLSILEALVMSRFVSQSLVPLLARGSKEDLITMQELLEAGTVTPVIDRMYPLREVPEAIRYLEEGHARGKVVITVEHN
jgi:NADPH:quinone reductase-like Zn-dependent oxidoreductase